MSPRRWSLAGRVTRLFVVTTSLLVAVVSVTGVIFLTRSVDSELDALVERQIKEMRVRFLALSKEARSFEQPEATAGVVRDLARDLPNPVAWRIWDATWWNVRGEYGAVRLLGLDVPSHAQLSTTVRLPDGRRWRTEILDQGLVVGVVLDGSPQLEMLARYKWFAGALLLCGALLGLVFGYVFMRRVSRILRRVAESARAVRPPAETVSVEIGDAPDEIRDVVDALHQLLENVRQETERSRVLLASMAHELRSPIQNLVGETEVALFSQRDAGTYRRVLESNLEEMRDLGDAIDNLVTICADQRVAAHNGLEEFDLADEALLRLQREKSHAERHGVQFHFEARGDTRICGDREGLLRALRNLAANAVQWSKPGSRVDVRVEGKGGEIVATVDDAGPGVPEDLRESIFLPFVRGPAAQGQRIGYGLGLAIVRTAVEGQGGRVEVERSPAGGARFRMVLPVEAPERAGASSEAERRA